MPKSHRMIAQGPAAPPNWELCQCQQGNHSQPQTPREQLQMEGHPHPLPPAPGPHPAPTGPQPVPTGPGPQPAFTDHGSKSAFTGPVPKSPFIDPSQFGTWACICQPCPPQFDFYYRALYLHYLLIYSSSSVSSNISNSSNFLELDNTSISMPILVN